MMELIYADTAIRQLKSLERATRDRIIEKVHFYISQPDPLEFAEPLTGLNAYRFRVGDYRVVFQREKQLIFVLSVRRRGTSRRDQSILPAWNEHCPRGTSA